MAITSLLRCRQQQQQIIRDLFSEKIKIVLQFATKRKLSSISPPKTTLTMNSNKVAICHMRTTNDKEHNKSQVLEIVRKSKEQNATFLFLPECCDFVGNDRTETLKLSEPITGPTVQFYQNIAMKENLWLSIGGFHELVNDKREKIYNSHLLIDNHGKLVEKYRKLHLYDVDTPEFKFRESNVVVGGDEIISPISTPIGQLALMICYDVRFSELSTILRKRGANILTYPSAFAYSTGKAHWEILLRSRAIETQSFVIASAQIGFHNEKRQSYGHAMIVDPWGRKIAECDNEQDVCVAIADLDMSIIDKVRANMPCLEHRRNDIYSLIPNKMKMLANNDQKPNEVFFFEKNPIDEETIFCESEHSLAFTNIRCVVVGHVLVASRRPVYRLKDLTVEETIDFFKMVCQVQKMTEIYYGTDASTVTVQDGEKAGQTVRHVHCHIMPRRDGDFKENDEIYVAINRHDHPIDMKEHIKSLRSLNERSKEAAEYREMFEKLKNQCKV